MHALCGSFLCSLQSLLADVPLIRSMLYPLQLRIRFLTRGGLWFPLSTPTCQGCTCPRQPAPSPALRPLLPTILLGVGLP